MADGGNVIFKFLGDDSNLTKSFKSVSKLATSTIKALAGATAAVGAGVAGIVTASVNARGELEQLQGGINKLFGEESAKIVEENANKAFKTAGISANEYLDQVTSFSAALVTSLKGDTTKAAEVADRAIRDMADNANTFGTSMESIQNAYQGFAKGNYTMLDNLKLGFAGTKEGMTNLIKTAAGYKDIQKELNVEVKKGDLSFANIANAISVVQKQMQVMGTTEAEAAKTLTGSIAAMKAAWGNFLAGTGNMGDVLTTAKTAFDNVKRIIDEALPYITDNLRDWMPEILQLVGEVLGSIGNAILENLPVILELVGTMLDSIMQAAIEHREEIAQVVAKLMIIVGQAIRAAIPYVLMNAQQVKQDTLNSLIEGAKNWGKEMLYKFAEAIYNNLFKVVSALLDLKNRIAEKFNELKREAIQWGWNMLIQFAIGISNKIQNIRAKIDEIKTTIQNKFRELINSAANWGRDMVQSFANGVTERLGALRASVENVANSIKSRLHFSRPDIGPLRDYETWLPDMVKGMANSLDKASPFLIDKVNSLANAMNMSPTLNGNVNNNLSPNMNVVVNNQMEIDPLGQVVNQIKTFSNGAKNDYNYGYGG